MKSKFPYKKVMVSEQVLFELVATKKQNLAMKKEISDRKWYIDTYDKDLLKEFGKIQSENKMTKQAIKEYCELSCGYCRNINVIKKENCKLFIYYKGGKRDD